MNISTGISEIIFQTRLPGKILLKKAYYWPGYNAGKVNRISGIHKKNTPEINYINYLSGNPSEKSRALQANSSAVHSSGDRFFYSNNKSIPGSIFQAFA